MPGADILDESDEILRHKYQLIYAVGKCKLLPDGRERWVTAQALLRQLKLSRRVLEILKQPNVASFDANCQSAFGGLRLLSGVELDSCRKELVHALAEAVIEEAVDKENPYEMRWLKEKGDSLRKAIITFVTDPAFDSS